MPTRRSSPELDMPQCPQNHLSNLVQVLAVHLTLLPRFSITMDFIIAIRSINRTRFPCPALPLSSFCLLSPGSLERVETECYRCTRYRTGHQDLADQTMVRLDLLKLRVASLLYIRGSCRGNRAQLGSYLDLMVVGPAEHMARLQRSHRCLKLNINR